jgi:hypothetical protein
MSRRLQGGVPRADRDHRRRVSRTYSGNVRAVQARYPNLGRDAALWLREYGLATVELEQLHQESQHRRLTPLERARVRRQRMKLRGQLLTLERRLEELGGRHGHGTRVPSPEELLAGLRHGTRG